jgi:hypothetical protein
MVDRMYFMIKDIKGWEGKYAVTDDGRVWSHKRIIATKSRHGKDMHKSCGGLWLATNTTKDGKWYMSVVLGNKKTGLRKGYKIHRLVAEAFIPNPKNLKEVNHKNGIKTDNRIENLEWCTRKQNLAHGYKISPLSKRNTQRGEKSWCHKLTSKQVEDIKVSLMNDVISMRKLAKIYGVSSPTIQGINHGLYWAHILPDMPIPYRSTWADSLSSLTK